MEVWNKVEDKLTDYWEILIDSIPKITISLIIVALFSLLAIVIARFWQKRISHRKADNRLVVNYVIKLIKTLIILAGIILALHTLGFSGIAGGLLAGAGVGAIVIGFAFKEIGENFLAGMILVFDRPFNIGDTVTVKENMGKVQNLLFRSTHIKTFDGRDVYIPNSSVITNEVYNHTQDGFLRHEFVIGIDYDDDIDLARQCIFEAVNTHPEVIQEENTQVLVSEFGTNTVNLRVMFWVNTIDYKMAANLVKSDVMRDVKNILLTKGFGLPANIQEFKMYRKEPIPIKLIQKEE